MLRMGWQMNTLYILFVIYSITPWIKLSHSSECIFDNVKIASSELRQCSLKYENDEDMEKNGSRSKRSTEDLYKPIRITVQFFHLEDHLRTVERERLKRIVRSTVDKVSNIFRVVPVQGPLLLARSSGRSCGVKLSSGINAGKCGGLKSDYAGEYCLDRFHVPDEHLEGLYLWNETHPTPVQEVYAPGPGIPNTDYILYVRSLSTQSCVKQGWNTISYAAYCQVDQNDRPVAGYINFCPELVRDPKFDEQKVAVTALHEIFHALGFASDLFPKFKDCIETDSGLQCTDKHKTIFNVNGIERLVTPKVVNLTSTHFGCQTHQTINEFGPILQTENGIVKSHWDSAFMHGSLMTPNVDYPHVTLLDPITLAVFEDSGWYRVNYNYADTFLWGKGGGCKFGQNPSCEQASSPYFCSGSSTGCHFLQYDKGTCGTDVFLHECRLFRTMPSGGTCFNSEDSPPNQDLSNTGEVYEMDSRCFMSNATLHATSMSMPMLGRCFQHICNGTEVYVKVGNSPYCYCPFDQTIQIPGYLGVVQCPPAGIMCNGRDISPQTTPTPEPSTRRHPVALDPSGVICIDIFYSSNNRELARSKLILFQSCNLDTILLWTKISRRRLENFYVLDEQLVFRFDLLPVSYSDDGPTTMEVLNILKRVVQNGSFEFLLPPWGPTYVASDIKQMDGGPTVLNPETPVAVIAGAAVGAVAGAIVIGVLVFFIQRYYAIHHQRMEEQLRSNSQHIPPRQNSTPNTPRSNSEYSRSRSDHPRSTPRSEDSRSRSRSRRSERHTHSNGHSRSHDSHFVPAENESSLGNNTVSVFVPSASPADLQQHRPSILSLPEGSVHSVEPNGVLSHSDAAAQYFPSNERELEYDQHAVTIVI